VTISWTPVAGATEYRVYGRNSAAQNVYWTTTSTSFTDTGTAGTSGTPRSPTYWLVKNLFELKNAQDLLVEENVFENNWVAAQNGFAIVFTPRNQEGTAPWSVVQRVMFRNNLVRHTAGGVSILGTDNEKPSQQANHITVRGNVFDDMGKAWGSGSRTFEVGDGGVAFAFDHNTIDSSDTVVLSVYGGTTAAPIPQQEFSFTNNMSEHSTYGILGAGLAPGWSTINAYLPTATITRNVLAGGNQNDYPAGNFFPTISAWQATFVDFANADYRLVASSPYRNAGTDGTDLGANINVIAARTPAVIAGDNRASPGIVTPSAPGIPLIAR
jgi:hypothetical protein